jgi:hypothetical protein
MRRPSNLHPGGNHELGLTADAARTLQAGTPATGTRRRGRAGAGGRHLCRRPQRRRGASPPSPPPGGKIDPLSGITDRTPTVSRRAGRGTASAGGGTTTAEAGTTPTRQRTTTPATAAGRGSRTRGRMTRHAGGDRASRWPSACVRRPGGSGGPAGHPARRRWPSARSPPWRATPCSPTAMTMKTLPTPDRRSDP